MTSDDIENEKYDKKEGFKELAKTFIYAVGLALVFRSLLFEPFHIPSGSMRGTLLEGDYIFVNKFSYGYSRYSFPLGGFLPEFDRIWKTTPKQGDVIVFRKPNQPYIDYIKRLIGMPGDTVQVTDGVLYVNGQPVLRTRIEDFQDETIPGMVRNIKQYIEILPNDRAYMVLDETQQGAVDFTEAFTVPEGQYFFMGDNRDNSVDSRYMSEVGFVPEENLVGRAEIVLFSLGGGKSFLELWEWPEHIRPGRFSMSIL